MRIAKWARKNPNTLLHIAKWAWKKIASLTSNDVDKMYVILPFEKHFMKTNIIFGRVCGSPLIDFDKTTQ
jgi:lipid A disaccharide synthetase